MATEKWGYRGFNLRLENGFTQSEARAVVDEVLTREGDHVTFFMSRALPEDAGAAEIPYLFVKAEYRRPDQALRKRFRDSRAVREGRGFRAFAAAGLPVAELHFFGEQSRLRPRGGSIVVTRGVLAPNAAEIYADGPDLEVGRRVMGSLAGIHARGLVHGDPLLRNFVPTPEQVWIVELPAWGRANERNVERDLARLLGAALRFGADHAHLNQLCLAYLNAPESPAVMLAPEWQRRVMGDAEAHRREQEERERVRAARGSRRIVPPRRGTTTG
jgi:hypothetical protein